MNTVDLINAALDAKKAFDTATVNAQAAADILRNAIAALKTANQALHDDLDVNGPCVVVDDSTTPPVVTLYMAVDPDTYSANEIRIAA